LRFVLAAWSEASGANNRMASMTIIRRMFMAWKRITMSLSRQAVSGRSLCGSRLTRFTRHSPAQRLVQGGA
jgi:hypothetical protein